MSRLVILFLLAALAAAPAQERTHIVHAGETLETLAAKYGVDVDSLREANALGADEPRIGRRLVIPAGEPLRTDPPMVAKAEAIVVESEPAVPAPAGGHRGDFAAAIAIPAAENVRYNGRWVPPGESSAWVMDCSNTTRWLYREARGVELPRTASDQYEWLRARRQLWRVRGDAGALRRRLRPGDLLFWEDTYRPVRRPPVTHVMLYLGLDARGRMMMAGSQGASGPDVYEFHPAKKMGGYRFFLFFRRDGKFVAFGRP